ncbi:hypothetical protein [Dehalococcoides mccartyi]|uniref:hypothetical protein n=1 Tax=Dehalococcoides mccartyi TaxID=61435 RepID=UPI0003C810EC|nr:hypothetical protein [Dehalococcoides mccartyi]AHB12889.1 hypothetical protein GY50_0103 [Dehalococcoides mccartyi GY50]
MRDWELFKPKNRCYVWVKYLGRRRWEKGLVTDCNDQGLFFEYKLEGTQHVYHEHAPNYQLTQFMGKPCFGHIYGSAVDYNIDTGEATCDGNTFSLMVEHKVVPDAIRIVKGKNKASMNLMSIILVIAVAIGAIFVYQNKDTLFNTNQNNNTPVTNDYYYGGE